MDSEARRQRLRRALGDWRVGFGAPVLRGERAVAGTILQDLLIPTDDGLQVPAFLARPPGPGPFPAVLYCHAHGNRYDCGRDELVAGRPALQGPWLGDLAALGVAALCLEMPCFGERQEPREGPLAKALLWQGRTLFGRMLAELSAGLDLLARSPGIDAGRLGVLGLSMGATQAFWLGALEPRLAAVVHLCCFADLETLVATGAHDLHGIYMTVPGLLALESTGALAGLAAPTPQLACVGLADPLTPPAAVARARAELEAAYAAHPDALEVLVSPDTGHLETAAMRQAARAFLARHLAGPR